MTSSMRQALKAAGLDELADPGHRQPHELPRGSTPPSSLAEAGLDPDEIVPGLVALRMDPLLLLDDDLVQAPQERDLLGIAPFVCLEVADDSEETRWAALTAKPAERLAVEAEWRLGGNAKWKNLPLFLLDARADRLWAGPKAAFAAAAWREAITDLARARLTPEGLKAIREKVNGPPPASIPVDWEGLARATVHPLQVSILEILGIDGGRILSPNDLSQELQIPLSNTNYHVTALARAGLIVQVDEKPIRGAMEHFYCLPETSVETDISVSRTAGL